MSLLGVKKSALSNHRRPFLWFLLFVQFILIVIFMIFSGGGYSTNGPTDETALNLEVGVNSVKFINDGNNYDNDDDDDDGVLDFSENHNRHKKKPPKKPGLDENHKQRRLEFQLKNFTDFFFNMMSSVNDSTTTTNVVYCFREGTETYQKPQSKEHNEQDETTKCVCQPEWHGQDCGQPEVLWRSFMTSKVPILLSSPRRQPHHLFYVIQTTGISIETLDIQMMELKDLVEIFVLCDLKFKRIFYKNILIKNHLRNSSATPTTHSALGILELFQRGRVLLIDDHKCTPKIIYKKVKTIFGDEIKGTDVLVYSKSDEILSRRAIAYFKWYDNWPQPVHFRLKYTVFGFFWQHPESTRLGSVVSQFDTLESLYKSDPERMLGTKKPGIIVGDLNHYGGWFCQYCYQPIDVVQKLEFDRQVVKFDYRQVIDAGFVENLVSNGLFVDGKMHLVKLHRYSEKYFSPDYVNENSRRFDNILTNIFARWDDNGDDYGFE